MIRHCNKSKRIEPKKQFLLLVKKQIQNKFEGLTTPNFIASQFELFIYLQNLHKIWKMSNLKLNFEKEIVKNLKQRCSMWEKNQFFDFVKEKGLSRKQKNNAFTTKIDH